MTVKKIGFACKLSERHPTKGVISIPEYNVSTTTISWLNRQSRQVAEEKLWDLMKHNIESVKKLVTYVGDLDEELRMVRLSSDILPAYTHDDWSYFWQLPDVRRYIEQHFQNAGSVARERGVRLSFHPGQFCVLASDNENIVNNSIAEFEYHTDMARWMGYGQTFQDFKINVHIAGRQGTDGIRRALNRLSPEARNTITIENEEMSYGLDDCLLISDVVPIVLDIHHHWIKTGEYIDRMDPRIARVVDSWRGVRPTCHYSVSREDCLVDHDTTVKPEHTTLLTEGYKKTKLRAHSDFMWNSAVNEWAKTHNDWADIMVEAKGKNLASMALYESWK